MTYRILATKLYIPYPRTRLVSRPRLIEQLQQGLDGKLTLISAPAGFGKTILLSEWIGQSELPFGWLSLDESDNDLGRFLAYAIASLQSINIEVDGQLPILLQSQQSDKFEAILIPLINQILSSKQRFGLVLDDYHIIQSKNVHETLIYLLDHLPTNMHLVIAGRADPPLPLAKMRARGEITEVRTADLRFSIEEGGSFLNEAQGLELSRDNVQTLVERTDGWIAALQMASIALKHKKDPAEYISEFSGSRDYIADFLTSEVIDQQPEMIYNFMLKTSILERLSGLLCDAVTDQDNSQEILKKLRDANLFLISLDDESLWYRYHRLFADLINQRLLEKYPDDVADLYRKASEWFEANDYPAEAIDYALRGNLLRRAAALIETQAEAILIRSELTTFIRWMQRLPDEVIIEHEALCVYYAWALLVSLTDPEPAQTYLEQVTPINEQVSGQLDAVKSIQAVYRRQISEAIDLARHALERLPNEDFFFRQIAAWNLSAMLFITGDHEGGAEILAEVAKASKASKNLIVAIIALCRLGTYHLQQGDLHKARGLFEQAIQIGSDDPEHPLPVTCEAMFGLGKIYWEWYQLERAIEVLLAGIELSKSWREISALEAYLTLAQIQQTQGDTDSANRSIQEAQRLATQSHATDTDDIYVASQRALLQLRQGRIRAAQEWAIERGLERNIQDEILSSTPQSGVDIILRYEVLVYTRLLLRQNRAEEAVWILKRMRPSMEKLGHRQKILEIHILTAIGLQAQGKYTGAITSLKEAYTLAETPGYVRIFLDEGPVLFELIQKAAARGVESKFATTILNTYAGLLSETAPAAEKMDVVEKLSEREIEVLRWLTTELSGPEIATQLYISVSTFRTHVKHIYAKLGVNSRFEATIKAKDSQLL